MTSIAPGLCSVTFRGLPVAEIVELARGASLEAIEWGADVHVPPGAVRVAQEVRERCAAEGIACPSYGSYFMAGHSPDAELDAVLDSAAALGASTVRVWAPGDPLGTDHDLAPVVQALERASEQAAERSMTIALEYHPGTLTETSESTTRLLALVARPNLRTYWQPHPGPDPARELDALRLVLDHLAHVHVFSWTATSARLPLADHADLWVPVVDALRAHDADRTAYAYLEFVADDDPEAFLRDAATLRAWLGATE